MKGAEVLQGRGDMLYLACDQGRPIRLESGIRLQPAAATPDVAAPEAGKVVDVSAMLARYKELLTKGSLRRSLGEEEEIEKLPHYLSEAFGLSGKEDAELLEAEEVRNTRLSNAYLSTDVIRNLIGGWEHPDEIYPLLQRLPNILPLAQEFESAYKAWLAATGTERKKETSDKEYDSEVRLRKALTQMVEAEVGPMQPISYEGPEEDALERAIRTEPQDQEAIKVTLAARNRARLNRLRETNDNMTRWNSFFEKRLAAMGKAIKPSEGKYGIVRIIDKPAGAPPAAFDAAPTTQEATKPAAAALIPEQKPAGGINLLFGNLPSFSKALRFHWTLQNLDGVREAAATGYEKGVLAITLDYDPSKASSINEAISKLLMEQREQGLDIQASRVEEEQTRL